MTTNLVASAMNCAIDGRKRSGVTDLSTLVHHSEAEQPPMGQVNVSSALTRAEKAKELESPRCPENECFCRAVTFV